MIAIQLTFEKYDYEGCPQGELFLEIISQDRNSEETIYIHILASINVLHTYDYMYSIEMTTCIVYNV